MRAAGVVCGLLVLYMCSWCCICAAAVVPPAAPEVHWSSVILFSQEVPLPPYFKHTSSSSLNIHKPLLFSVNIFISVIHRSVNIFSDTKSVQTIF